MPPIIGRLLAADAPPRTKPSNYPEPFASRMAGREKRPLGDPFGLTQFGVNLTTLAPGAISALHHRHASQDEWVYVVSGEVTLHIGDDTCVMHAGECAGFPAGGLPHHLENRSSGPAVVIEAGSRTEGDAVDYPSDDLAALRDAGGRWKFAHKDGRPY
ncbi:cupin domain-containing protein [Burkholderia stagnalis]